MAHIAHVYSIHLELGRYNFFCIVFTLILTLFKGSLVGKLRSFVSHDVSYLQIFKYHVLYTTYIYIYIYSPVTFAPLANRPCWWHLRLPRAGMHGYLGSWFGSYVVFRYPVMVIIPGAYMFNEGSRDCDHPWEYFFCN